MYLIKKLAILSAALLLAACDQTSNGTASTDTLTHALSIKGEHAILLSNQQWLSYGPDQSITLSNAQHQTIDQSSTKAAYLDHRELNGNTAVFAINQHGQPSLIQSLGNTLSIKQAAAIVAPLEGLCLYQTQSSPLQVFLLDEHHMASQYLINEFTDRIELQLLRRFPLPPGAESCAVHDNSDQFFVSEEGIGVWAYSARAESEVKRTPVDLVAPFGKLKKDAGPLAIIDNTLFIAESGHNFVHRYDIQKNTFKAHPIETLTDGIELDSLTAKKITETEVVFWAVNDASGQLIQWLRPFQTKPVSTQNIHNVMPLVETAPVKSQGDAADDPAIWVHPTQTENSLIIGTNKKRGLYIYDLNGNEKQELLVQRVNNVDVRQGFTHKGKAADIAAASQRDRNTIALFHIEPSSGLFTAVNEIKTGLDHVYGLCMYTGKHENVYVFINDQDGRFEQWRIMDSASGWQGKLVREFAVASQPEGCTVDESQQRLFIGEENVALWTLGAEPNDSTTTVLVSKVGDILTADIEGMEVYAGKNKNWLVVSSQGNDSYVIFDAKAPYKPMGEFRITLNQALNIDGASETDGLTVSSVNFGGKFPDGLLVVQDGRNFMPEDTQNFKLVSWRDVSIALGL
ncbi:MAG: 3-phytase [Oceanicoccus sp.]|jgi:3-phytase